MLCSDNMNNYCSASLVNGQEGSEVTQATGALARLHDVRSGFIQHSQDKSIVFLCDILAWKSSLMIDHALFHLQFLPAVKHRFSNFVKKFKEHCILAEVSKAETLASKKASSLGVK